MQFGSKLHTLYTPTVISYICSRAQCTCSHLFGICVGLWGNMQRVAQSTSAHMSRIALPRRGQNDPRVPQLDMGRYLSPQGSPYVLCQSCLSNISASRCCVGLKRSECQRDCFYWLTDWLTDWLTYWLTYLLTYLPLWTGCPAPSVCIRMQQDPIFMHINSFTASACKISGLKNARTRLQTVYVLVL